MKQKGNMNYSNVAVAILNNGYVAEDETIADRMWKVATAFSSNKEHAQRIYKYIENKWFTPSTPVITNSPQRKDIDTKSYGFTPDNFTSKLKAMPISCFLSYVDDSVDGLVEAQSEAAKISTGGGGLSGYWGDVRAASNKSPGAFRFMRVMDTQTVAYHQSGGTAKKTVRRGAYNAYLPVSHPDFYKFLYMRKLSDNYDVEQKCLNLHHTVVIPPEFYKACDNDVDWDFICPHSGKVEYSVPARKVFMDIITTRKSIGEPCIFNTEPVNQYFPQAQKDKGLECKSSNLCTEITLAINEERTAVCCLSSVNAYTFDEWKNDDLFVKDVVEFLDNIIEYFINNADPKSYYRAINSAKAERALGLGICGLFTYIQSKGLVYESAMGVSVSVNVSKTLQNKALKASQELAKLKGEPEDMDGTGYRNSHLLAVAPNAQTGNILGVSPSIEPYVSNVFTQRTIYGNVRIVNPELDVLLRSKVTSDSEYDLVLNEIESNNGSVQDLDILSDYEKEVFKTAFEINQLWVVEHALARQPYICQAQSVNIFIGSKSVDIQYLHAIHWKGRKLKTMYYMKGLPSSKSVDHLTKFEMEEPDECLACQG